MRYWECDKCGELVPTGICNIGEHQSNCPEGQVILVYGGMHAVYIKRSDIGKYTEKELDVLMKEQILEFLNNPMKQ